MIVTAYDRYEYGRFERDRMGSKWGKTENPIYRPAKRQFENPVYAGGVGGVCQVGISFIAFTSVSPVNLHDACMRMHVYLCSHHTHCRAK